MSLEMCESVAELHPLPIFRLPDVLLVSMVGVQSLLH